MFADFLQPGLHGAFLREGFGTPPQREEESGALAGLRLAVKDVFDVRGLRAGFGNPAWLEDSQPVRESAAVVRLLLAAGARWVGKTVTDELTYSLAGVNVHYGTPVNQAAAGRIPGGSSSGSAAAVAGGHADIGLGTDCGGSIRLPASYCGLWGMRPTHGRISATGCLALAHSFDTVGWFARDPATLARVFETLAHSRLDRGDREPPELVVPEDLLPTLDAEVRARFAETRELLAGTFQLRPLPAGSLSPSGWAQAFRVLQAAEIWQRHGEWFRRHGATMGEDVRARFESASGVDARAVAAMQRLRVEAASILARALARPGSLLLLPTVPGPAPLLSDSLERLGDVRGRSQQLLCLAGLAGLPQVSFPWIEVEGAPVGLSLVGARHDDETVLAGADAVHAALGQWFVSSGSKPAISSSSARSPCGPSR